jgi:AcrR family transcriptional regulator
MIDSVIYSSLFEQKLSLPERRRLQIASAAIQNYVSVGLEKTTYERIAKASKISRPLIFKYFKDKEEIFTFAIKYIRANFQSLAVEAMQTRSTPTQKLEGYIDSTFQWIDDYPDHVKVWLLYYYRCGIHKKLRRLNTDLTVMGQERIGSAETWGFYRRVQRAGRLGRGR